LWAMPPYASKPWSRCTTSLFIVVTQLIFGEVLRDWSPQSSPIAMARDNYQELVEHPNGLYDSETQIHVFSRHACHDRTLERVER
jgi:hypothetical protein